MHRTIDVIVGLAVLNSEPLLLVMGRSLISLKVSEGEVITPVLSTSTSKHYKGQSN